MGPSLRKLSPRMLVESSVCDITRGVSGLCSRACLPQPYLRKTRRVTHDESVVRWYGLCTSTGTIPLAAPILKSSDLETGIRVKGLVGSFLGAS